MRSHFPASLLTLLLTVALVQGCASTAGPDLAGMSFSSEPLLGKVVWNDLLSDDADAARSFYSELFGWTFERARGAAAGEYWVARSGDVYVGGLLAIEPRDDGEELSRWLPYVSVADVDGAVNRAAAAGAEIPVRPRDVDLGRVAAIIDPEGAVIGLARSSIGDPDDATTAPAANRVVWTELLANEPQMAAAFYRDVVGYEPRTTRRRGGEYTFLSHDGIDRAGLLANPSEQAKPRWLTYFGVDDPAAAAERAEELGGSVLLPASPELREGTMAVVTDPSGALLVLQQVSG